MSLAFLGNIGHRMKLMRELPPRLVLAKIAKRLPWCDRRAVRVAEIVNSPKDLAPGRLIEFFRSQSAVLAAQTRLPPIEFAGRRVLEIGPGPLAGWGPMAVFRGAKAVYGVDPDWVDGVFDDPVVEEAYLRPHHAALVDAFGPLMDYARFRSRLSECLTVVRSGLKTLCLPSRADLVLSNSCLEHIADLDEALASLARITTADARFMHLVNFGNHRDRASPFSTIYEMPPEAYRHLYGRHINLQRPPDIARAFATAGINAEMVVVDSRPTLLDPLTIDPWWSNRYDRAVLAVRTALFVNPDTRGSVEGGEAER